MPKYPGNVTKHVRIAAAKEVLERWGRLDKNQIDEKVASSLGIDAEEISRALYRDLAELVTLGLITDDHFTRDGIKIEDFDPEKHKNTFCQWVWNQKNASIVGLSRFQTQGADLLVSQRLQESVRITDTNPIAKPDAEWASFCFLLGTQFFNLQVKTEALPFKIYIGRIKPEEQRTDTQKELESYESKCGKRTIALLLPIAAISTEHAILDVQDLKKMNVNDLESRNGTFYIPTQIKNVSEILHFYQMKSNSTVPQASFEDLKRLNESPVTANSPLLVTSPSLLGFSQNFQIILP